MHPSYCFKANDSLNEAYDYAKTDSAISIKMGLRNYSNRIYTAPGDIQHNYNLVMGDDSRNDWVCLANDGKKIDAIKWIRAAYDCSLIVAKDIVDLYQDKIKLYTDPVKESVAREIKPATTLTFCKDARIATVLKDHKGTITLTIDPDMDITEAQILDMLNMVRQ